MDTRARALVGLGRTLRACAYTFTTITPESHRRVLERQRFAKDLRDVFGWCRVVRDDDVICREQLALLEAADAIERTDDGWRSRVRFSTAGELIVAHSAFPTTAADAVFFGPDSYRFLGVLQRALGPLPEGAVAADIGTGSGIGAVWMAHAGIATHVLGGDVNPAALRLCTVNAVLNDVRVEPVASDMFEHLPLLDLAICNPPYLVDDAGRAYRDGGGALGLDLALRFIHEGLPRLKPHGTLVLYTGVPIRASGVDPLRMALAPLVTRSDLAVEYEELDPDVFGEELDRYAYRDVERIAVVAVLVSRR